MLVAGVVVDDRLALHRLLGDVERDVEGQRPVVRGRR